MKLSHLFESTLFTELRWYIEFGEEHNLHLNVEIEDGLLFIYHKNNVIKWTYAAAYTFRTQSLARVSMAIIQNKQLRILGEPLIATDVFESYRYSIEVLKGRFKLGEPTIATDAKWSYYYAKNVIRGRFELGEPVIATDPEYADMYKLFTAVETLNAKVAAIRQSLQQ